MTPPHRAADLLIAGGGMTGASVARDAAMRGLRVVLVEQGDFVGGRGAPLRPAMHLDDLLLRRTSWHSYYGPRIAEEVSHWMVEAKEWTELQRQSELHRFRALG